MASWPRDVLCCVVPPMEPCFGVTAPGDALRKATTPRPPPRASWLLETLSIRPPRRGHHWTSGTGKSSSPAGQDVGFAVLPVDTLVTGAEAKLPPPALHGSKRDWLSHGAQRPPSPAMGVFVGVTVPPRQPPGPVPAVEDKGWTTSPGEAGSGPLHHPKVAGATRRRSLAQRPR